MSFIWPNENYTYEGGLKSSQADYDTVVEFDENLV